MKGTRYIIINHPNGLLKQHGMIKDGKLIGLWQFFSPKGNIEVECCFIDNKYHSSFTSYHPNTKLKITGHYDNGIRVGQWDEYNKSGLKIISGNYISGLKEGLWNIKENGLDYAYFYKNGKSIQKRVWHDEN